MRAVILTVGLAISMTGSAQALKGLEGYVNTNSYEERTEGGTHDVDVDDYNYELRVDRVPTRKEIGTVIAELKRVLELNGRTLESYDALIPDYNTFSSFDPADIVLEMQSSFHVGFRYIMGEYSVYMYAMEDLEGTYSVGFHVDKTSNY